MHPNETPMRTGQTEKHTYAFANLCFNEDMLLRTYASTKICFCELMLQRRYAERSEKKHN